MHEQTSGSAALAERLLHDIRDADLAAYRAIAAAKTPTLEELMRRLSRAADHSRLWLSIASVLAARPGRSRRAARLGVTSIAVASAAANLGVKSMLPRRRPDRTAAAVPLARQVPMPRSTSFPSGHTASAFAFAAAVGSEMPWLSLPLNLLAIAVAYSRVYTGVHYPSDALVGAALGEAAAAVTVYVARSRRSTRGGD